MHTVGVVAGSFDPITRGHEWLIDEASRLVDELHVVVGVNPSKKYFFTDDERLKLAKEVVEGMKLPVPTTVSFLGEGLLVRQAVKLGATHLIRGIRNMRDFDYEVELERINRKVEPHIRTVYLHTPAELLQVSSSLVRGMVGVQGWEDLIRDYAHPVVIEAFKTKAL